MNEEPPPHSADRMPTLTEVLELEPGVTPTSGSEVAHDGEVEGPAETTTAPATTSTQVAPGPVVEPPLDTRSLVNEVLGELQPRIDMLFEARLREALAPALARAAEGLIREARSELSGALRELVDAAVKRALQRRGGRW